MNKFSVGDRVVCVKPYDGNEKIVGVSGTVVKAKKDYVGVAFDKDVAGHDLDGDCIFRYGWYFHSYDGGESCIERLQPVCTIPTFDGLF